MIHGGLAENEVRLHVLQAPWFHDFARNGFGCQPEDFVQPLLDEMLRSKAAGWCEGRLIAPHPHEG